MAEADFLTLPLRRLFRTISQFSDLGWLITLILLVAFSAVYYGFYQLGLANPNLITTMIGYLVGVSFTIGLWAGYARLAGDRPAIWRLVSRTAWFYTEQSRSLVLILLLALVTLVSFGTGVAASGGASWWQGLAQSLGLIVLTLGVAIVSSSLASLIKLVSQNVLVRVTLLLIIIYLASLLVNPLAPVTRALGAGWTTLSLDTTVLLPFIGIGVFGVGMTLAELILPRLHIRLATKSRYWSFRLPTAALGGFGAGTAIFVSEIVYFLRSSRIHRRLIAGIVVLGVGLVTINFFSPSYRANAETLFYSLIALTISFLTATISYNGGRNAEDRVERYRHWPVSASKIRAGFWAACLVVTVFVCVIFLELFAASAVSSNQLALLMEVGLLSGLVSFAFGQASHRLERTSKDPLLQEVIFGSLTLLALVLGAILLLFNGVVSPLLTGETIAIWALGTWLIAQQQLLKKKV